ncbi:phosphatase PAP2 family protein [Maribacter sp. 2-571]|uniref:vanadium-dependent haloperoxidase n=1 Tax=Maribacter sp. 2-571 TaxID=3417569 RepID=UPI003D349CCF
MNQNNRITFTPALKHCILPLLLSFTLASCKTLGTLSASRDLSNVSNELVLEINKFTYTIANEHDQFYSFIGVRALAMVHLAIHDIFNSRTAQYKTYHFKGSAPKIDPLAASITATKTILTEAYPDRKDTIAMVCEAWLQNIPHTSNRSEATAFGERLANNLIVFRKNDGHRKQGNYTPMTKPGNYRYTPGYDWVLKPDFSVARPFTLDSLTQFRSPAPPSIASQAYAESFEQVKTFGKKNSGARTTDQTDYAHWWAEFGEHSWNRIGRITARKKALPIVAANRMFALLNMNLYDLYLASLESKYHYDTWRPYTAIKNAALDGNTKTRGDRNWKPEMVTPPWPEYPSAHAATGAAGAEILTHIYGTAKVSFAMQSTTALPNSKTRYYSDLDEAANECADSRIMNGYHFGFATEEGKRQGRAIAKHTIKHFLNPNRYTDIRYGQK